ncbi:RAMP superfamily CRISPR-associated protein [Halomonas sp. LS-001]
MTAWQLTVELHHYWHAGSGSSSGTHLDALCERDNQGLPFIAGRHLKGLLRHALQRAEQWQWLDDLPLPEGPQPSWEAMLFGTRSQAVQRFQTLPGLLMIDDARLPAPERAWLHDNPLAKSHLFEEIYSTAINENGTAVAKSLRGMEAALPMMLTASVSVELTALESAHRQQQQAAMATDLSTLLGRVLPLIDSVGGNRTRGLGEAVLSLSSHTADSKLHTAQGGQ